LIPLISGFSKVFDPATPVQNMLVTLLDTSARLADKLSENELNYIIKFYSGHKEAFLRNSESLVNIQAALQHKIDKKNLPKLENIFDSVFAGLHFEGSGIFSGVSSSSLTRKIEESGTPRNKRLYSCYLGLIKLPSSI
jgi:hypothetical protein